MKLYSGPLSLFTGKVRVALAEKGLAYDLVPVPFTREGYKPKLPEVLAINPKGQVPVLVDGDVSIYDSTIILEYLEDRYPTPALYPRDPAARAYCRQAEAAADEILFPHVLTLVTEVFYKRDEAERDAERIRNARASIESAYRGLDAKLEGRRHVCGEFTVADIAYVLTITFGAGLGAPPPSSLPHLGAWLARVSARPSVRDEIVGLTSASASL